MSDASPDRHSSTTHVTARGYGMAVSGVALGGVGVGLASPLLTYVGVTMACAAMVAGLWMFLSIHTFALRFPYARRDVTPRPLSVGAPGTVTVRISAAGGTTSGSERTHPGRRLTRAIVEGLDIREQAAAELTGMGGTKATVARTPDSLTLTYTLNPDRRGRWPLGPALVRSGDPLGMVTADTAVGGAEMVPVWPAVFDLSATAGALMGHADRVVLGARTPAPDDASLRDYREGDDLRRVHWKSTARRGTMLVRSDERAGRRPACVIMDLPRDPQALEWTISAGASIALSVLDSGHPVRLIGGGINPEAARLEAGRSGALARAAVLNSTVDLSMPVSATAAERDLLGAAREAALSAPSGEVVVGIFEPLPKSVLDTLVPIGESGRAWAVVRSGADAPSREAADTTARSLRRAGWRTTVATTADELDRVWSVLLTAGDME